MDVIRYDWAHTFLADSMVGRDLWLLIEAAEEHNVFTQQDVHKFLSENWSFTSAERNTAKSTKWNKLQQLFIDIRA